MALQWERLRRQWYFYWRNKELADAYLPKGQSGIVTFGIKGGFEAAKAFTDATKVFSLLANIGDTKSLIIHPASTTHQQLKEEQEAAGVTQDLIRLSVGLEDIEDLKADIEQAFGHLDQRSVKLQESENDV